MDNMYHYQTAPHSGVPPLFLVRELKNCDALFFQYKINVSIGIARQFLMPLGDPWASLVDKIMNALPAAFSWATINNAVTFWIGREYSRVVYVDITKTYFPNDTDWSKFERALEKIGEDSGADERYAAENTPTRFIYRLWWD